MCLVCSENSREVSMAREKQARGKSKSEQGGRIIGDKVRKVNGRQEWGRFGGFAGHCKDFGSYLE